MADRQPWRDDVIKSIREFTKSLAEMLDAEYLVSDKAALHGILDGGSLIRLNLIKEIAKMIGMSHIERKRCACCGSIQERGYTGKYCPGNACKQKAYRIRHGQIQR